VSIQYYRYRYFFLNIWFKLAGFDFRLILDALDFWTEEVCIMRVVVRDYTCFLEYCRVILKRGSLVLGISTCYSLEYVLGDAKKSFFFRLS
jgi:hypothetical protein